MLGFGVRDLPKVALQGPSISVSKVLAPMATTERADSPVSKHFFSYINALISI